MQLNKEVGLIICGGIRKQVQLILDRQSLQGSSLQALNTRGERIRTWSRGRLSEPQLLPTLGEVAMGFAIFPWIEAKVFDRAGHVNNTHSLRASHFKSFFHSLQKMTFIQSLSLFFKSTLLLLVTLPHSLPSLPSCF